MVSETLSLLMPRMCPILAVSAARDSTICAHSSDLDAPESVQLLRKTGVRL